jgi:hypothetical protein
MEKPHMDWWKSLQIGEQFQVYNFWRNYDLTRRREIIFVGFAENENHIMQAYIEQKAQ